MRRRSQISIHSMGCTCKACTLPDRCRRTSSAFRSATRALILLAAVTAIPFIVAHALTRGGRG